MDVVICLFSSRTLCLSHHGERAAKRSIPPESRLTKQITLLQTLVESSKLKSGSVNQTLEDLILELQADEGLLLQSNTI